MTGIPLSYVGRANEDPDHETDYEGDFVARSIACAPLNNATFRADARKVHQLLMNFLVAEWAEQWIKNLAPRVNGRLDMEALRNHYGGEGDASQPIATAKKLRETLHYKSERSMPFSTFLDRMQKMFNIFQEEGEELTENTKFVNYWSACRTISCRTLSKHFESGLTLTGSRIQKRPTT